MPPPPSYATATTRTNLPIFTEPPASSLPPLIVQNKPLINNQHIQDNSLEMQNAFPGGSETPPASSLPPLVVQNKPLISNIASNGVDSLEMQSTLPGGSETQNAPRIQPANRLPPINGSNDGEGVPDAPWYEPPK